MKIMDADGDGVITESELDQLKVPFPVVPWTRERRDGKKMRKCWVHQEMLDLW